MTPYDLFVQFMVTAGLAWFTMGIILAHWWMKGDDDDD